LPHDYAQIRKSTLHHHSKQAPRYFLRRIHSFWPGSCAEKSRPHRRIQPFPPPAHCARTGLIFFSLPSSPFRTDRPSDLFTSEATSTSTLIVLLSMLQSIRTRLIYVTVVCSNFPDNDPRSIGPDPEPVVPSASALCKERTSTGGT
jgi:hypothetical protein